MTSILLLETSTHLCSVGLSVDNQLIAIRETSENQSHSELITSFIEEVISVSRLAFTDLSAVAVSMGPGSYTGLRIGVSTAKGICYALDIPLIAIDTLRAMAFGMLQQATPNHHQKSFFCPMIDARRMEVYTAVFDHQLGLLEPPHALILSQQSLKSWFEDGQVWIAGDGANKCLELWPDKRNLHFLNSFFPSVKWMAEMAHEQFNKQRFADLAYFEPFYLKDFIAGIPRVKGL